MTHSVSTTGRYRSVDGERARVAAAHAVEAAVDPAGEAALGVPRAQQPRAHHRRQRQRHDARDDHGAGERERELAEQRSGQAALNADRRVDGRQRDRHRDDRPDQLARGVDRRLHRPLALVQVAFDVLHHHDRIVHDEADRQDDGEQRQQVDREAGDHHQEHGADRARSESRRSGSAPTGTSRGTGRSRR